MSARRLIGLLGCLLLFLGVFAPIEKAPIVGSVNYYNNGKGAGAALIVIAVVSAVFVLTRLFKALWVSGIVALALTLHGFFKLQRDLNRMKSGVHVDFSGTPFEGLAQLASESVQMQWGWAVLIIGAVLLIASAAMKEGPAIVAGSRG